MTVTALVRIDPALHGLLPARHRRAQVAVRVDGAATIGHAVESLGLPRTEMGPVTVDGRAAEPGERLVAGTVVAVLPVARPQRAAAPRFVLDVHLGTLARRMRLLGIDAAYRNDADDPELVEQAVAERRILLTQDRGLLRRRALPAGALIPASRADDQLADVLDRFDPPLAPWTRCPACNGVLARVPKEQVAHLLEPGTRAAYDAFSRCPDCGRVYWRGAHADRLDAVVSSAGAQPVSQRDAGACPSAGSSTGSRSATTARPASRIAAAGAGSHGVAAEPPISGGPPAAPLA
jgi:uncharacterized protein